MRKRFLRAWHRLKHYLRRHVPETLIAALLFAFFIVFFAKDMFYTIPAGYVGVLWERFGGGTVLNRTLGEGPGGRRSGGGASSCCGAAISCSWPWSATCTALSYDCVN